MEGQISGVINLLTVVGAYFAIILVLSIAVETVLDSIKNNRWLQDTVQIHQWMNFLDVQKKRVSPDQAMRDIAQWVPVGSQAEVQIAALNNMVQEFGIAAEELTAGADAAYSMANELVALTGISRQTAYTRQQLAQKLYVIRRKYEGEESMRVTRLRRISAGLGIVIAVLFQLDTFRFLSALFSPEFQTWFDTPSMALSGMLLTGFASSAGSSFWHDQLDRIRAVKQSARSLQSLTAKVV